MNPIIPTIFAHNKKEFRERLKKLLLISKNLQIDFMDGKFVRAKSVLLYQIPDLNRYEKSFEAHLMVKNPIRDIKIARLKGFKKVIFHYEALHDKKKTMAVLKEIKNHELIGYIALNPETTLSSIAPFVSEVDGVLFMGVHPGEEHQLFIPSVYKKIKELRRVNKKIPIQVDGGVNEETIKKLAEFGVNYVNSGSYIADAENPAEAYKKLTIVFREHKL